MAIMQHQGLSGHRTNSHVGMFIKPIFYFAVRKFVCKLGATTNIYGRKYRIQSQFSKSQGTFSSHFASHILGLSVKAIFNIRRLGGVY